MDTDGVGCAVVYPSIAICTYVERDRELALACMRSYNDWMLQEFAGDAAGRAYRIRGGEISESPVALEA